MMNFDRVDVVVNAVEQWKAFRLTRVGGKHLVASKPSLNHANRSNQYERRLSRRLGY